MTKPTDEMTRDEMAAEIRELRRRRDDLLHHNNELVERAREEQRKADQAEKRLDTIVDAFRGVRVTMEKAFSTLPGGSFTHRSGFEDFVSRHPGFRHFR